MRLATVLLNGTPTPGILSNFDRLTRDRRVFPLRGYDDTIDYIAQGAEFWHTLPEDAQDPENYIPYEKLLAPILRPPKLICIGLNYKDHAIESNMDLPTTPVVFTKFSNSIIGPGDTVLLPRASTQVDYEAELAIVIGRRCRDVQRFDWTDYVFGFTILNDVSARDIQLSTSQWSLGKSFDTFCPMGPCIVTRDELPDPHELSIRLSIGRETLQDSNTDQLIFKTGDLIQYLSGIMTLEPGDIISTGTPAGVGLGRKPQRWLKPGEIITVGIQGIGSLTNPIAAEPRAN